MQREGFGIRLGAALLDVAILMGLGLVIGLIGGGSAMMMVNGGNAAAGQAVGIGTIVLMGIVGLGYTLTEIFMAGTPGKQVLGLIIADEKGVRATTQQLATRWIVKNSGRLIQFLGQLIGVAAIVYLGGIVALIIVIGCFFVLGQTRQAFHDRAAKTAVFKKAALGQFTGGFPVMAPGSAVPPAPMAPPPPAVPPQA